MNHSESAESSSTPFLNSPGGRTFLLIWLGQLISTIGSNLTSFALGVYVYEDTGSTTLFALSLLAFMLPQIVISPFAGALVDRWDRRKAMILSDTGAGLCTLIIVVLYLSGGLEIWHILVATFFNSTFNTIQWPAWSAAQSLLIPKEHLGRASSMTQMTDALAQLLSPLIAGLLFGVIHLGGIVLIDFITFGIAVTTLALAHVPRPPVTEAGKQGAGSLWSEARFGLTYIMARKPLLGLLAYFAIINFFGGMLNTLFGPLLLDISTPEIYGLVGTIIGCGMLVGAIAMSVWGGPKRKAIGVLLFGGLAGLFIVLVGVRLWIPLIAAAGFGAMFTLPITDACSQAIWQSKVEPDVQGRVFSVRRTIAWGTQLPAILLAGPLVDWVFNPLMAGNGILSGTLLGEILTLGAGRGIGMAFMVDGALVVLASLIFFMVHSVRNIDTLLPDAVGNVPQAAQRLEELVPETIL